MPRFSSRKSPSLYDIQRSSIHPTLEPTQPLTEWRLYGLELLAAAIGIPAIIFCLGMLALAFSA